MKIWIDGYEANQQNRVGSGQFAFEVIKNLEKLDNENEYTILLPQKPLGDLPKERKGWAYKILKPSRLWTRITLPLALYSAHPRPDLIFSPTHYIPRFSPVKRIGTIFDLSYLHFPEMFNKKDLWQLKNWSKFSIENAEHLITISDFTKKDLAGSYGVSSSKVTVAYPGYDRDKFGVKSAEFRVNEVKKKYRTGDNYIIYIGTIQPRKNLVRLIEAFSLFSQSLVSTRQSNSSSPSANRRDPNFGSRLTQTETGLRSAVAPSLVIVGKTTGEGREGWKFKETLEAPKKFSVADKVIFTGFVPSEDLPELLSGAKAFVLPSLWEGFGIPVAEAMGSGVPVIVSNVSSLPEVAGSAGTYFDPYSVEDMAKAIEKVIADPKLQEKKIKLGLEQAKKFSWENCAQTILETFRKV